MTLTVEHLFISPGHNFFGRHGQAAGSHPIIEVEEVECVAGQGLRGDRFFDYRENYKGQVTLFAAEIFAQLCEALSLESASPAVLRRNVVVRGGNLNDLIGAEFELQGVRLVGTEECRPCYWMDSVLAPGAEQWLKQRGGLRCRILTNGWLRRNGV
jgi:MOSC domain-containing protein YiiM